MAEHAASTIRPSVGADHLWQEAFPAAISEARPITAVQTLELLRTESFLDQRFVLVDLRRVDYEGGSIHGSINLPAQSLYPTIPALYRILKAAGVCQVIWYCGKYPALQSLAVYSNPLTGRGSSRGRGNRAASWFNDYLQTQQDTQMESLVLLGGIKGWVSGGEEYVRYVQGYDKSKWEKQ